MLPNVERLPVAPRVAEGTFQFTAGSGARLARLVHTSVLIVGGTMNGYMIIRTSGLGSLA